MTNSSHADAERDLQREDHSRLESVVPVCLGRRPDAIESIMAGLGARRFYRLRFAEGDPATLVARFEADAAPSGPAFWLPEPPLEPLRAFLEEAGLPVPRSFARMPELGLDLLEDVGNRTLLAASGAERDDLVREACDLLPRLQALSASADRIPAFGRRFDRALLATKAWKWIHWTIPALLGRDADAAERAATRQAFERIAALLLTDTPLRLAHRDYKAENLHWPPEGGDPARRLVMIDIQGAFLAPPEYDLVCLLYDIQADLDEDFVQECVRAIIERLPDAPEAETAALRFDAIATARLCKDVSHVVQAAHARGDMRRWHEIPRGLALLERAAGRLAHTFPEIRALTSVIPALTAAAGSSDIPRGRRHGA